MLYWCLCFLLLLFLSLIFLSMEAPIPNWCVLCGLVLTANCMWIFTQNLQCSFRSCGCSVCLEMPELTCCRPWCLPLWQAEDFARMVGVFFFSGCLHFLLVGWRCVSAGWTVFVLLLVEFFLLHSLSLSLFLFLCLCLFLLYRSIVWMGIDIKLNVN